MTSMSFNSLANYHWREGDVAPGYGNNVTEGIPRHFTPSIMSNDLLRDDLKGARRRAGTHLSKLMTNKPCSTSVTSKRNKFCSALNNFKDINITTNTEQNAEQFARDHHLRANRTLQLQDRYLLLKLKQASRPFQYLS